MSIAALNWVFDQAIGGSARKFVLVALADYAGDTGDAYPAVSTLVAKTELDRKTVIAALKRLAEDGWITDTGRRTGTTRQIVIWRINGEKVSVPDPELFGNSPVFPRKASRFSAERLPKTGHGTIKEPSENVPPNPQRGEGRRAGFAVPTNPLAHRLGKIFGRAETTEWSPKEQKAFKLIAKIVAQDLDGLEMLERYYARNRKKADNICRRDLITLLNNYPGEVDRARDWCEAHPLPSARKVRAPREPDPEPPAPEQSPEELKKFCDDFERQFKRLPFGHERNEDGSIRRTA